MATVQDLIPLIYHEKQQPGEMLCAQHALNSLLQGQYFSAPDLSEIARELDEDERRELDEEERAQTSNNMDDTGFFSVQVLQKALSDSFNLTLAPWGAEELRPYHGHPHTQMAFILNHAQHWYTIRRFGNVSPDPALEADPGGGHWFNLNSFNDAPERIGKLYLGMFLQQAQQEGYSIFAVIQRDIDAPLALPRVEADELFATIPEDSAGNFSYNYSAARGSSSAHHIEGFEDEDMELQAALQASLGGGDYGEYIPQRFAGSSAHAQPQPPSRTSSGVPIRRDYQVIEPDEDEDDEDFEMREEPEAEPADPVAASMARQRAIMERMRRAQEYALQDTYENEAAQIEALARMRQTRRGADEEDEEEMLRRAIAESEAMARAQGSGRGSEEGDDGAEAPAPVPAPVVASNAPPAWHQHRVYDDEDEELQAALRASLETVPPGFRVPSPEPPVAPTHPQPPNPPAQTLQPPSIQRQPSSESIKTESEDDAPEPEPELSPEEIRKRRLARFGG